MNLGTTEHHATNEIFSAVEIWSCIYSIIGLIFVRPTAVHDPNKNRDKTSSDSKTKTVTFSVHSIESK